MARNDMAWPMALGARGHTHGGSTNRDQGARLSTTWVRGCSALNTVSKRRSALDAQHHGQRTQQSALDTALVALGLDESQCPMERLENDNCNGTARNGTSKIPIIRHRLQLPINIASSMVERHTTNIETFIMGNGGQCSPPFILTRLFFSVPLSFSCVDVSHAAMQPFHVEPRLLMALPH